MCSPRYYPSRLGRGGVLGRVARISIVLALTALTLRYGTARSLLWLSSLNSSGCFSRTRSRSWVAVGLKARLLVWLR